MAPIMHVILHESHNQFVIMVLPFRPGPIHPDTAWLPRLPLLEERHPAPNSLLPSRSPAKPPRGDENIKDYLINEINALSTISTKSAAPGIETPESNILVAVKRQGIPIALVQDLGPYFCAKINDDSMCKSSTTE